jgi:hypothetical protein
MVSINFYTVILFDQFGNNFKTVAAELGDQVHVHSLTCSDGTPFQFESELYHLRQSCKNKGILCYINPASIDVHF